MWGGGGGGGGWARGWKRGEGFYAAFNCSTASPDGYQAPFSLIKRAGKQKAIILCIISDTKRQFMPFYDFCGCVVGGGVSLSTSQHTQFFSLYVLIELARSNSVFSPTSLCHSSVTMQIHNQSDFSRQEVLNLTTILCVRDS